MRNAKCKKIIRLRSGKEYEGSKLLVIGENDARDELTLEENAKSEKKLENLEEIIMTKDKGKSPNHLPFPTSIQRQNVRDKTSNMLEVLKQVNISICLLDMIK